MINLILTLLSLTSDLPTTRVVNCELAEWNVIYQPRTNHVVFEQVILWRWHAGLRAYVVTDWFTVHEKNDRPINVHVRREGHGATITYTRGSCERSVVIRARCYQVTRNRQGDDPEVINRSVVPVEARNGILR